MDNIQVTTTDSGYINLDFSGMIFLDIDNSLHSLSDLERRKIAAFERRSFIFSNPNTRTATVVAYFMEKIKVFTVENSDGYRYDELLEDRWRGFHKPLLDLGYIIKTDRSRQQLIASFR